MTHTRSFFQRIRHHRVRAHAWRTLPFRGHMMGTTLIRVAILAAIGIFASVGALLLGFITSDTMMALLRVHMMFTAQIPLWGLLIAALVSPIFGSSVRWARTRSLLWTALSTITPSVIARTDRFHAACLEAGRDHLELRAYPGKDAEHWDGSLVVVPRCTSHVQVSFQVPHPTRMHKIWRRRTVHDACLAQSWADATQGMYMLHRFLLRQALPATQATQHPARYTAHQVFRAAARQRAAQQAPHTPTRLLRLPAFV